jgi:hypothetical protein
VHAIGHPVGEERNDDAPETLQSKIRREHAECAKAIAKMSEPKTLNDMLEEHELEMAED